MRTEIGTNAVLSIPDGWINAEHGKQTNRTVTLGHLIADHKQWIVLKSIIETTALPTLTLSYIPSNTSDRVSISCDVTDDLKHIEIAEQVARVRIAVVYNEVYELLESGEIEKALKNFTELITELKASIACKENFILTALAQIEEMKESITAPADHDYGLTQQFPPGFGPPMLSPTLNRSVSMSRAPSGPPVLSRLASNTVALTNQRGFFSRMSSGHPDETYTFSSPAQRQAQQDLTQSFVNSTSATSSTINTLSTSSA
jgi:ethanolamine utilization microcompartment shell protein EutS